MTTYIFHIAGANERWDTIAYQYYKNVYKIACLIEANPHIPIAGKIPEGVEVKVPIGEENKTDNANLPVWKRNSEDG